MKSNPLKKDVKVKLTVKKEKSLFGERDEAVNTLTLEIRLLTEELEFTKKRIATYEGNAAELEQRIENLDDLLKEIKKPA
jgi:hypothetical protein